MKLTVHIALVASAVLFSFCKKTTTPTPTPVVTPPVAAVDINHKPTVEYTVDGTAYSYTEGTGGVAGGTGFGGSFASSTTDTSKAVYSAFLGKGTTSIFDLDKGTLRSPGIGHPDTLHFRAFFAPGTSAYSADAKNGVVISYWDASNTKWASDKGTDQTGSTFKIETCQTNTGFGSDYVKVYATFTCKVYNDNGNSKTLTNGKFVGYFSNN